MPINPIAASLLLYFEISYNELLELNEAFPHFLKESLSEKGYFTLHLMPVGIDDPFEEFNSWPREDRDLIYFKMTQRRKAAACNLLTVEQVKEVPLQAGVINVIKFTSVKEFMQNAESLSRTPNCCFTVLYVVNSVPKESVLLEESRKLFDFQQSLCLLPSVFVNCTNPDWTRFAVSCSKGSEGEFRVRSVGEGSGLFDLRKWREFAGGWTQLYTLKAELSNVIGITGKYGD